MNPQSLSAALVSTATRIGLAVGCGTAGSLTALALLHHARTPVIAAGVVTAALTVNAASSALNSVPAAVEAIGSLLTALIRARADAKATVIHAKVRAELARAGLDPGKTHQAVEMQRLLPMNPDLPQGRRPADETLIKLHLASRARNGGEPGTGPDTPGNSPGNPKAATSKVVPIRSDT
jgi:hypothetical protein